QAEREVIARMVERGLNSPLTSSAGRLFDAVSALIGVSQETSYEAQAAIELEQQALAASHAPSHDLGTEPYPFGLVQEQGSPTWGRWQGPPADTLVLDLGPFWQGLLADLRAGVSRPEIAWRFHLSLAELIVETCERLRQKTALDTVALSGGCFQNRLLLRLTVPRLRELGFEVLTHRQVPCNDGGIALGQAAIAHLAQADPIRT
ncbi:MAG: hypothetical protein JXA74_18025, partial [Anaerolineae bacterium]|nr:hypothetical protein [Anaerolineae bacterium]